MDVRKQQFNMVKDGFNSVNNSLRKFAKKLGKDIVAPKEKEINTASVDHQMFQVTKNGFETIAKTIEQIEIERIEGIPGHTPTDTELLALIKPLIPKIRQPEDGHTPTKEEILALIKTLIPEVKDGETPSDERLLALIKPLIPEIKVDEASIVKKTVKALEPMIPKEESPDSLAVKLGTVKKQWLPIDAIKGDWSKYFPKPIGAISSLRQLTDVDYSGLSIDSKGNFILGSGGGSGGGTWGSITGTLSNQTDLQAALDSKTNYWQLDTINGVITPNDNYTVQGLNGQWYLSTDGSASFANGQLQVDTSGNLVGVDGTFSSGRISLGNNTGSNAYINADGSAWFAMGNATIDGSGNITGANLSGTNTGDQDLSGYAKLNSSNQPFTSTVNFLAESLNTQTRQGSRRGNNAPSATYSGTGALSYDDTGGVSIDWQNRTLYTGFEVVDDIGATNNQILSLNWLTRKAYDLFANEAIDWNSRKLYKIDTINEFDGTPTETFDWQNLKFPTLTTNGLLKVSGSNGTIGVDTNTYVPTTGYSGTSVDLNGKVLKNFFISKTADTTAKFVFDVGALSTATTRTLTVRDISGTLALTSDIPTVKHTVGFTIDGGGSAVTTGKVKGFFTAPFSGNITAWNIVADTGTCTIKVWKVASGTAKPTSANSINTSGIQLSSGTAIHSTTLTDFTSTTVTANDIFAFNVEAVSEATELSFNLEITQ